MGKKKVLQTLFSGLGGHSSVAFSLLESSFGERFDNYLLFYGIEEMSDATKSRAEKSGARSAVIIKKPKRYLLPLLKFYKLLKAENPDAVIIHDSELIFPAALYKNSRPGKKVIFVEHQPNQKKSRLQWLMSDFALKRADAVVCLNESYKNELLEKFSGRRSAEKIRVIPNGINTEKFNGAQRNGRCRFIGMASRLNDTKDHQTLIKAFSLLVRDFPNLKLKLAGSGEMENKIRELVRQHGIEDKVELLGLLDEDQMVAFLNGLDLYVHATLAETLSTSILQAMACALPVITSDINNNRLLIDDGRTGYLYKNSDAGDLYRKMKYAAIENYTEAVALGAAARKKVVENFSHQTMGEKYLELIEP
jgi:glycosyltransferase involved in cell wall biosynthesis